MISDQNYSSQAVSVPSEAVERWNLMFSTLGRALPIEIRVNVKARRPRLKAARAPLKLDKISIKLGLNLASAVDH